MSARVLISIRNSLPKEERPATPKGNESSLRTLSNLEGVRPREATAEGEGDPRRLAPKALPRLDHKVTYGNVIT
jgi:hypothetical protein